MRVRTVWAMLVVTLMGSMAMAETGTRYGTGVTLETPVAVKDLLSNPGEYVGKAVRVDGVITGVCERRGCWIQVTDPELGQGVRIKVEDGVIVFPPSAMGRKASAQGTFEALPGTAGEQHQKDEKKEGAPGHTCADHQKQEATRYQISGTGAIVY
jgi:hypothetical protein